MRVVRSAALYDVIIAELFGLGHLQCCGRVDRSDEGKGFETCGGRGGHTINDTSSRDRKQMLQHEVLNLTGLVELLKKATAQSVVKILNTRVDSS